MIKISVTFDERTVKQQAEREVRLKLLPLSERLRQSLQRATPIDTGEARQSWIVSQRGTRDFTISNDEDYVRNLNAGSSRQAPANFIERVVLSFGRARGTVVNYK